MTSLITSPTRGTSDSGAQPAAPQRRRWWVTEGRPAWSRPARLAIFVATAVLYTWDLSRVGMGNSFYAAAVKSGTESWKAFFFGSLDPGSFITVDKPPGALWLMELSGRVFGFSSLSMLLPEAIGGVVVVMVLYHLVRKWSGELAAVLAASAMAVTPVAVVMFRYNNPDGILTLSLVLAGWALWSALETARTSRLILAGALVGFAFTTKTLEAFIVVPAMGLVYLWCGKPGLGRRLGQLAWGALALLVASSWWVAIVELWPAASRPYIGGSTNNSELNLVFGYNGFSRIFGSGGTGGRGGPSFAGAPGILRMFNDLLGGQISWLVPMAVVGLAVGLWVTRSRPRPDLYRAGFVLWGGWLLMYMVVFSDAKGIFHPYYTVALAPAVAALAGTGAVAMWRLGRQDRRLCWLLPVVVLGTAIWGAVLLGRTPGYDDGLSTTVVVAGALSAVALLVVLSGVVPARALGVVAGAVAAASVLAGPAAYSLTTVSSPGRGALASAGPATSGGFGGAGGGPAGIGRIPAGVTLPAAARAALGRRTGGAVGGGAGGTFADTVSPALVSFLERHQGSARYLLAVSGSQTAAPYILQTGRPVIAMGGFTGSDPSPTLAQFKHLVASGQVRYVLVQSGGGLGGGGFPGRGGAGTGGFGGRGVPGGAGFPGGPAGAQAPAGSVAPGAVGSGATGGAGARRPSGTGGPGGRGGPGGGASASAAVDSWVRAHGTAVASSAIGGSTGGGTLYYVRPAAARS